MAQIVKSHDVDLSSIDKFNHNGYLLKTWICADFSPITLTICIPNTDEIEKNNPFPIPVRHTEGVKALFRAYNLSLVSPITTIEKDFDVWG